MFSVHLHSQEFLVPKPLQIRWPELEEMSR